MISFTYKNKFSCLERLTVREAEVYTGKVRDKFLVLFYARVVSGGIMFSVCPSVCSCDRS